MDQKIYNTIANSAVGSVLLVVLFADRFPHYKPLLFGLSATLVLVGIVCYFRNLWANYGRATAEAGAKVPLVTPGGLSTSAVKAIDVKEIETALAILRRRADNYTRPHELLISRPAETSMDDELSEFLHRYFLAEFGYSSAARIDTFSSKPRAKSVQKPNPKLKYRNTTSCDEIERSYGVAA